jgi:hypothetical protein
MAEAGAVFVLQHCRAALDPPELMIRMRLIGYCFGIRSERRLCEEVHLNLAYRWFCRLGLGRDGDVPDHSICKSQYLWRRDAASAKWSWNSSAIWAI